jgi:hypothetical protein
VRLLLKGFYKGSFSNTIIWIIKLPDLKGIIVLGFPFLMRVEKE